MSPYERSFEEEVLERLAVIAIKVEELPALKERVTKLESHRTWLAGVIAALTTLAGLASSLHFFKV